MRDVFIFLGIFFFLLAGSSQTMASDVFTLEESIDIALERSLAVLSADEEIKAKEFEEHSAKADFYPKLSTSYTYTYLDKDTVDDAKSTMQVWIPPTGPHVPREVSPLRTDNYQFNITATQPLFTGWRLTVLRDLASLGVDTAKIQKVSTIQDLVLKVKVAYFAILKTEKLQNVARQAVEQLEGHLAVAQAFYDEGIIAKNELLQTEVQMAQSRQDLISVTHGVLLSKSLFNKLLRRELTKPVRIKDILDYTPVRLRLDEAVEKAVLNRSEIQEVSLNVVAAEKNVKLTKSSYYPSVTFTGNYSRDTNEPFLSAVTAEDPDIWTLTLQADWTLWEWGKRRDEVAASRARVAKARHLLNEIKDNISLEVQAAYLSLEEAKRNIQVSKTAVVQAEENYRMNEERYKQQVATSTDVLDAQTLLTQARANHFNALSDYNIAWARLERAMGIGYETEGK